MKLESKFKPGDKVFHVLIDNDKEVFSLAELSIDVIESVVFYGDKMTYRLPSCDWEVEENQIVEYDMEKLFKYLEENLYVNGE